MRRYPWYLLIAFSATCLIAFGFLLAFWVQDYWKGDESFGHSQVEQFIRDRPGVGDVINSNAAFRKMLESRFEGNERSGRIIWDCNEPGGPAPAEHGGEPAVVRVSNSADISAVDKCSMLAYELINFSFHNAYMAYERLAYAKQISREDFASSCVRIEMSASQKAKEYFQDNPIADEVDLNNPDYAGLLNASTSLPEYLRWMRSESYKKYDILEYYRQGYDKIRIATTPCTTAPQENTPTQEPKPDKKRE